MWNCLLWIWFNWKISQPKKLYRSKFFADFWKTSSLSGIHRTLQVWVQGILDSGRRRGPYRTTTVGTADRGPKSFRQSLFFGQEFCHRIRKVQLANFDRAIRESQLLGWLHWNGGFMMPTKMAQLVNSSHLDHQGHSIPMVQRAVLVVIGKIQF